MNKLFISLYLISLIKLCLLSNPCTEITVKPYEPNQIYIERNTNKCVYFSYDNPSEGNIILKLAKSNSFTSYIYIYDNEDNIDYDTEKKEFTNSLLKYHIGEEFFKEKKLENMQKQRYYFVIYENSFYFNDELIIYNDKFTEDNYYELNEITNTQKNEFNFKYEYTNDYPIIFHFKVSSNIKYLNYQFLNINDNGKVSFYIYENNLENNIDSIENRKEFSRYVSLNNDIDYYIKIITDGEINLLFDFLETKIMKITPDDIFQKEILTFNNYYFYIEKELVLENDEYFNEFTIKLDSTNLNDLPFQILTNTCDGKTEEELIFCIDNVNLVPETIIKRDIDIPYIYHIYYSFKGQNNLVIKIINDNSLIKKQRLIIEASGGNELVDSKHEKVFRDNKGYLYPVYLNVSITEINSDSNENKNRLLFINTNTTSAIKIFFNEDTFKNKDIDIKNDEYITIENYVYAFDFNTQNVKKLFENRKYFTIMIYCPWESSPISFQLTFINDNINNFKYIVDEERPINSPITIKLNSPNEKYYFIGQYNQYYSNILFNEVVYGKIKAKYKPFNNNEKISRLIYNETANGFSFSNWTPIKGRIDIIEVTCISPALVYMHFIEDYAININNIVLEKGSQKYIFLNNTNTYNLLLSNDLKESQNVNLEVFIVSQRDNQTIDIKINEESFTLSKNDNNILLRYNTGNNYLESFTIQGKGKATTIRVKVSTRNDEKNVAYYKEYKKTEDAHKISKKINVHISNNNNKNVKLCYTLNFEEENYLYNPRDENCFELNKNGKTTISMYNPWDKLLLNNNKLYKDTDLYYLIVYVEDVSLIENLDFTSEEEFIDIVSELNQDEFISINNKENNLIKSSQKVNQSIIIQFSPITSSNSLNNDEDKYVIKSQFDEVIREGKLYTKNNRTYATFNDPLIDCFLELDIQTSNTYEIKYSIIPQENDLNEENINDNYNIEFKSSYIQFKPLMKDKNIDYSLYISFDTNIDLSSISNLKKLIKDDKTIYIVTKKINTKDDLIKIDLYSEIAQIKDQLNNKKWKLNILAEENDKYNIVMSYDVIEGQGNKGGEDNNEQNKENKEESSGSSVGKVFLWIFIIIIIAAAIYVAYYFLYKKRIRKDDDLLKDINDVNLSMEDQSAQAQNTEEGYIK